MPCLIAKKKRDPKQSQRQQTNSIIKAIEMLWTRKLHERLRGLDQCGASADYVVLFRTSNKHKEVYQ